MPAHSGLGASSEARCSFQRQSSGGGQLLAVQVIVSSAFVRMVMAGGYVAALLQRHRVSHGPGVSGRMTSVHTNHTLTFTASVVQKMNTSY